MTNDTQQSKMRLAAINVNEIPFTNQQLKTIRNDIRNDKKNYQSELNELNLDSSAETSCKFTF